MQQSTDCKKIYETNGNLNNGKYWRPCLYEIMYVLNAFVIVQASWFAAFARSYNVHNKVHN